MLKEKRILIEYKKFSGKLTGEALQTLASIQGPAASESEKAIWRKQALWGQNFLVASIPNKRGGQYLAVGFVPYKINKKAKALYIGKSIVRSGFGASNISLKMNAHLAGFAWHNRLFAIMPGQSMAKYLAVESKIRRRRKITPKRNRTTVLKRP